MPQDTVEVCRANVVLTVPRDRVDVYLAKGYNIIDASGNILKEAVPNDVNSLKAAYEKHVAEIKSLKAQIADLESKLKEAQKPTTSDEAPAAPKKATSRKRS